jgi:hypothetical protein
VIAVKEKEGRSQCEQPTETPEEIANLRYRDRNESMTKEPPPEIEGEQKDDR